MPGIFLSLVVYVLGCVVNLLLLCPNASACVSYQVRARWLRASRFVSRFSTRCKIYEDIFASDIASLCAQRGSALVADDDTHSPILKKREGRRRCFPCRCPGPDNNRSRALEFTAWFCKCACVSVCVCVFFFLIFFYISTSRCVHFFPWVGYAKIM